MRTVEVILVVISVEFVYIDTVVKFKIYFRRRLGLLHTCAKGSEPSFNISAMIKKICTFHNTNMKLRLFARFCVFSRFLVVDVSVNAGVYIVHFDHHQQGYLLYKKL